MPCARTLNSLPLPVRTYSYSEIPPRYLIGKQDEWYIQRLDTKDPAGLMPPRDQLASASLRRASVAHDTNTKTKTKTILV